MIDINISRAAWYIENWTGNCPTYREVYLTAYDKIKDQLGIYIIYFTITIALQAVTFRLWQKGIISTKSYEWIQVITLGLNLFWIFNLLGLYFLKI